MKLWELVRVIWPLLCHPNAWIRNGAVGFIASTAKHLPKTDLWCIVYPMIRPFLRSDIAEINEETLLQNIETPVSKIDGQPMIDELTLFFTIGSSPSI